MNSTPKRPPVIIIGMHRSGTSLITRLLGRLGLHIGHRCDSNDESLFFQNLNEWLLTQCGAAWYHPEPVRSLIRDPDLRGLVVDYLRHILESPRSIEYLGWRRWWSCRSPFGMSSPWGWKDPRNTFTLPVWMDLFPEARVIHICRHGIDVARSLQVRDMKIINAAGQHAAARRRHLWRKRLGLYWLHPKRSGFGPVSLCESLDDGLTLWETYMHEAEHHVHKLAGQAFEVKYEDFLASPQQHLATLATFCGLTVSPEQIDAATHDLRNDRAYAFRDQHDLRHLTNELAERLAAFGY